MDNELLKIDETIKFKKPKGYTIYEFHRLGKDEHYLSDNVEYFKYDSRKKTKSEGAWILVRDLKDWIQMLKEQGYEQI